jgi:hypothetical protein
MVDTEIVCGKLNAPQGGGFLPFVIIIEVRELIMWNCSNWGVNSNNKRGEKWR